MKPSTEIRLGRLRGRVPLALVPALVEARTRLAWRNESVREDARAQMRFLIEHGRLDLDLEAVARDYVRYQALRGEMRWHPSAITNLDVEGLEHLRAAKAAGRGVVLSFMHHAFFEAAFASLGGRGIRSHMVCYGYMLRDDAPGWLQQHVKVALTHGNLPFAAERGAEEMLGVLRSGEVLGIATDVPGHTPLRFAGRDVVGSFGAARLASTVDAPVVVMTSEPQQDGTPRIRLHPAFEPASFPDPTKLLEAIVAVHEEAQLHWPEAVDLPLSRWTLAEGGAQR